LLYNWRSLYGEPPDSNLRSRCCVGLIAMAVR
jgi:hypothetical protein